MTYSPLKTALVLVLIGISPYPALGYSLDSRWSRTATAASTGPRGNPIQLTWSLAPDDTRIPSGLSTNGIGSTLLNFLDQNWGSGPGGDDLTQRPWFPIFQQSFDRIGELSGVTFVYEPHDDGQNFSNANLSRGELGIRGDVRICGRTFGAGSNVFASAFFPNYGDIAINTDFRNHFVNSANDYRAFRNVIMHEAMHAVGASHVLSDDSRFLIEPFTNTAFDGPQLDDILALQRNYGDVWEKNGGNDTAIAATSLGTLTPNHALSLGTLGSSTQVLPSQTDFLSIDDDSDTDFFRFSLAATLDVTLKIAPQGTFYLVGPEGGEQNYRLTYLYSDLSLALLDATGTSLLASANQNPAGAAESISARLEPGNYFVRINGAANEIQLYELRLAASSPVPESSSWALAFVATSALRIRRRA